jgi:hypothetical protein
VLFALAIGVTLGCGGAQTSSAPSPPLPPEQARVFDQGVDFIGRLAGLEGRWREEWDQDLATRVAAADVIAVVRIKTVRTDIDPERRSTHRLVASVEREIAGKAPREIELAVRQDAAGFAGVDANLARLQTDSYIAFVKWFTTTTGARAAHFHLSPASDEVLLETEAVVAGAGDEPRPARVHVHTH